ncbi:Magnesium transporter MRS2-I [Dichanthelium oligosanthes]|uniref:Magnesium transporter n=1 Tax=Dichanthelium oligosanthes TaxID=888268 RepID=A0A1E5VNT8_9POAL|nr:Magnesium transporter MRS2-I [Dichanthelium oligosanthes]
MHRVDINARDLRILDPLLSYPSTILGRERAIVLNLEVLLRDPTDENVIPVVEELRRRLEPSSATQHDGKENLSGQHDVEGAEEDESPFEFRALEVTLEAICSFLDARVTELESDAYPALDELTSKLREYIDDTEDYINIQLDNHRNQLIQLELFLSSGTVCLSLYSLVAGVFGMNIPYTWNDNHGYVFKWVVLVSGLFCAFMFISIVAYARHKGLVGS